MVSAVEQGAALSAPLVAAAAEAAVAGLGDTKYSAVRNAAGALIAAINARDSTALTLHAKQISAVLTNQK